MEEPFIAAFSESNILAAYAKAGIWPFNPGAIQTAIHKLSKPSAINGEFTAGPCSPIKAIIASYQQELHAMLPQEPGIQEPATSPPASPLADHQNVQNEQEATSGHALQCLVKDSSISFIASAEPITPHKTLPHIPIAKPPRNPLYLHLNHVHFALRPIELLRTWQSRINPYIKNSRRQNSTLLPLRLTQLMQMHI